MIIINLFYVLNLLYIDFYYNVNRMKIIMWQEAKFNKFSWTIYFFYNLNILLYQQINFYVYNMNCIVLTKLMVDTSHL